MILPQPHSTQGSRQCIIQNVNPLTSEMLGMYSPDPHIKGKNYNCRIACLQAKCTTIITTVNTPKGKNKFR